MMDVQIVQIVQGGISSLGQIKSQPTFSSTNRIARLERQIAAAVGPPQYGAGRSAGAELEVGLVRAAATADPDMDILLLDLKNAHMTDAAATALAPGLAACSCLISVGLSRTDDGWRDGDGGEKCENALTAMGMRLTKNAALGTTMHVQMKMCVLLSICAKCVFRSKNVLSSQKFKINCRRV